MQPSNSLVLGELEANTTLGPIHAAKSVRSSLRMRHRDWQRTLCLRRGRPQRGGREDGLKWCWEGNAWTESLTGVVEAALDSVGPVYPPCFLIGCEKDKLYACLVA